MVLAQWHAMSDVSFSSHCGNGFVVGVITVLSSCANQILLQTKVQQRYFDDDVYFLYFIRAVIFSVSRLPFGTGVFVLFCPETQRTTPRRAARPQGTLTSAFMAAGIFLFVEPLVAGRFHVELGEARHMSRVLWWTTKSLFLLEVTAYVCQTGSRRTPFVLTMVGKCAVCVRIHRSLRFRSLCVWCSCVVSRSVRSPSWVSAPKTSFEELPVTFRLLQFWCPRRLQTALHHISPVPAVWQRQVPTIADSPETIQVHRFSFLIEWMRCPSRHWTL